MIKPGLERISLLLKDVPLTWRAIHVAGTNGKGSICAYISAVLQAANIRTGRFTSPHFIDRWDGICVNGEPVAEALFKEVEEKVKRKNEKNSTGASEFEILTATAFEVFNREKVQVGVVEVGMGGLQDATNVLEKPLVTVISQIGLDHQAFLGNTLPEIALQKAGIMKSGSPCVVDGHNEHEVLRIFEDCAHRQGSQLIITPTSTTTQLKEENTSINFGAGLSSPSSGVKTAMERNMWCAYKALECVMPHLSLANPNSSNSQSSSQILRNLVNEGVMLQGSLPGRFQTISLEAVTGRKQPVLMDGAHNEEAWIVLGEYVSQHIRSRSNLPVTWLFALSGGRSPEAFIKYCWKDGDNIAAVEFGPVEGMPWVKSTSSAELVEVFAETNIKGDSFDCGKDVLKSLEKAASMANEGPLVISGSLYLVSDVLRILRSAN